MAEIPPYPLYNRTYHLYRLSPLYHGASPLLNEKSLRSHARHLKDQLKGDNVRGVEVDFAGTQGALPNLGPLEDCTWDLIGDEDAWIDRYHQLHEDPESSQLSSRLSPDNVRGIQVTLEYETQSYNALLLRDPTSTTSPEGFTSLPLLMLKMPAPLRQVVLNYLRTTFDANVSPLRLAPAFLTSTLESYFRHWTSSQSAQSIQDVVRQLQLGLTFPQATTLLKHIDVTITGADVPGFITRGRSERGTQDAPFTGALRQYLKKHLALDLAHPKVQIAKLSCGAFTLSTDRVKLNAPDLLSDISITDSDVPEVSAGQLAVQEFYNALVKEATGTGKFLHEAAALERESSTPSSTHSGANPSGTRKRSVSTTATKNANAKRSKSRGKENGNRGKEDQDLNMQIT